MTKGSVRKAELLQRAFSELGGEFSQFHADEVGDVTATLGFHSRNSDSFLTQSSFITGKSCTPATTFSICGNGQTDSDGRLEIDLKDFVCLLDGRAQPERIDAPLYFVATPRKAEPVLLTFTTNQTNVTVYSWNTSGEPAPRIRFQWHCCARSFPPNNII